MKSIKVFMCMSFKIFLLGVIDVLIRRFGFVGFGYFSYLAFGWCVCEFSQVVFDVVWDIVICAK